MVAEEELILEPIEYLLFDCPHCKTKIKVYMKKNIEITKIEVVE